jgi:hypothetical protein
MDLCHLDIKWVLDLHDEKKGKYLKEAFEKNCNLNRGKKSSLTKYL